jgi:lipopolysaccharide export system permease protein
MPFNALSFAFVSALYFPVVFFLRTMSILSRYILRAHVGPFLFGACTVMFVFLLQFLMNHLNHLLGKGLSTWVIVQIITLQLAWMLVLAIPMGVLVATLMAFGNLSASNEVIIIKSGGGSLLRMMSPVLVASVALSIGVFWFNDRVLPDANYKASTLMVDIQRKKPTFSIEPGQFTTQIEGYSILARHVDSATSTLLGVTIYDNTRYERLNVVSADTGTMNFTTDFARLVLTLRNGEIHQINQQNFGDYRKITFRTHRIVMDAHGFAFTRSGDNSQARGDRTMCIDDMRAVVRTNDSLADIFSKRIAHQTQRHELYISGKFDSLLMNEVRILQAQYQPAQLIRPTASEQQVANLQSALGKRLTSTATSKSSRAKPQTSSLHSPESQARRAENVADTSFATTQNIRQTPVTLSREDAAWRADNRLAGLRSMIDNDAFQAHDNVLRSNQYLVEIHKKYAIPASCFVFALLGCPLGIITRRGNFGISGFITLIFYVIYWAFLITGERLADRGMMSPVLSMWLADVILGALGVLLIWQVSTERSLGLADKLYPLFSSMRLFIDNTRQRRIERRRQMLDSPSAPHL